MLPVPRVSVNQIVGSYTFSSPLLILTWLLIGQRQKYHVKDVIDQSNTVSNSCRTRLLKSQRTLFPYSFSLQSSFLLSRTIKLTEIVKDCGMKGHKIEIVRSEMI